MAKADHDRLNLASPLSEPTRQRRLMAAYKQRGYSRQAFAEQLNVAYSTLRAWDLGIHTMPLDIFCRACALVGYSVEEIATGQRVPPPSEPRLTTDDEVRAVFDELGTPPGVRARFAEHIASPAGRYQTITRAYVSGYVAACEYSPAHASSRAINEQVDAALIQAGHSPITQDELTAFIQRLVAARRKRNR